VTERGEVAKGITTSPEPGLSRFLLDCRGNTQS